MENEYKKSSLKLNYIYNLIYQIVQLMIPLITTPYLSKVLDADGIGIYSYTLSNATYFILFGSLGISLYGQREIAYVQNDKNKRSKIFWEIFIIQIITVSIAMIVYIITLMNKGEYVLYYRILFIELFSAAIYIGWLFQGTEDFKLMTTRNFIVKLIGTALIFILVRDKNDIALYTFIRVITIFIGNITLFIKLPKIIEMPQNINLKFANHLKGILILFIPQIALQLYHIIDKTMIGKINGMIEVGYYEQSQKIITLSLTIVTSLGYIMLPRISNLFYENKIDEIKKYTNKSIKITYFLALPMMFGLIAISKQFSGWFFGQGFDRTAYLIMIVSPVILLIGLNNITGKQILLPNKNQKVYTISIISACVINIVLNVVLIPKFGSIGACISSVITELSLLIIQVVKVRQIVSFKQILFMSKKYLIASISMYVVISCIINLVGKNILDTFILVISGIVTYLLSLFLIKEELIISSYERIKKLF